MDAADIVEVVSDFVSLKKRGTSYKGLCPFHDDTTPSFSVSPVKGVYKCFACGESGNVVNFVMKHEQMTYPEALKWLANKYHIEVKERELSAEEKQAESERESMFIVNEWAAKYFHDILVKSKTQEEVKRCLDELERQLGDYFYLLFQILEIISHMFFHYFFSGR